MRTIFISVIFAMSCTNVSDKEIFMQYLEESSEATIVKYETDQNTIKRYDDLGYPIDKHWFDKQGELYLYTFYNRFNETDHALFKAKFARNDEIVEMEGDPFYMSTNLITNDTIEVDTVKAFIYLADSPFLNPEVRITTNNISENNQYLVKKNEPVHVVYFEDYVNAPIQEMKYKFYYEINNSGLQFKDSLIYECVIEKK